MMKYALPLLLLTASATSQADILGLDFGIDRWMNDGSGTLQINGANMPIDDDDSSSNIWVRIEHPIPVLPNLRLSQQAMDYSVQEVSTGNTTNMDTSFGDAIAYYELLDTGLELDLGLGVKRFTGKIETTAIGTNPASGNYDVDNTLPVVYARGAVVIPMTQLIANLELQQGQSGDDKITDINLMLRYITDYGIGLGGGYRYMKTELEIDESGNTAIIDSDFKGFQLSLSFHL